MRAPARHMDWPWKLQKKCESSGSANAQTYQTRPASSFPLYSAYFYQQSLEESTSYKSDSLKPSDVGVIHFRLHAFYLWMAWAQAWDAQGWPQHDICETIWAETDRIDGLSRCSPTTNANQSNYQNRSPRIVKNHRLNCSQSHHDWMSCWQLKLNMFRLFRHQVGASGACAAEPEMRCGNLDSETGKHEGTGALTEKKKNSEGSLGNHGQSQTTCNHQSSTLLLLNALLFSIVLIYPNPFSFQSATW